MITILVTAKTIGESISSTFVKLAIWIASGIYHVAAWVFQVFIVLATGQAVKPETYTKMISNFYIVLGVILLFFLAFALLKAMVNPDDQKQGTSTVKQIVINLITSGIIMAVLPFAFSFLYDFQTSFLLKQNVIARFFGYGIPSSESGNLPENTKLNELKSQSFTIVNGVFTAFLNVNEDFCESLGIPITGSSEGIENCQNAVENTAGRRFNKGESFGSAIGYVNLTGKFSAYQDFSDNVATDEMDFQFLLAIIAGGLLVYVAVSFCFDMALRMIKLIFYQVIAPIPIFARVIPGTKLSDSFNTWMKITLACYMEVYVRIFVFYFTIYLCQAMINSNFLTKEVYNYGPFVALFSKAFLLMGLIMFMRQVPKLISEITGIDTGNMSLGIRNKLKDGGLFTATAAVGAGVTAGVRNLVHARQNGENFWKTARSTIAGTASGAFRGGRAGWGAGSFADARSAASRGATEAVEARERRAAYAARHPGGIKGVVAGHIEDTYDTVRRWAGFNNIEEYQRAISSMENVNSAVDAVSAEAKKVIASNASTGKTFTYGLKGVIDDDTGIKYSLDNYRALEDAIQRAQSSGGKAHFEHKDENGNVVGSGEYTTDELSRMFNTYSSNYADQVANVAFRSENNYNSTIGAMEDYKEISAMRSIRAKAQTAREDLNRVLNSEAIHRANDNAIIKVIDDHAKAAAKEKLRVMGINETDANYDEEYKKAFASAKSEFSREDAIEEARRSGAIIDNETINGDLRVTNRTALNYYGSAVKEVKGEYQEQIAKIEQKEKDKKGE